MRATLIPLDGGQAIELVKDVTVIGRKDFCDVRLEDPSVSKVHLIIAKSDGLLIFRDMGSTNGTKVNGQRVIRGMLLPNDKLQIAACKYQVQLLPNDSTVGSGPTDPQPDDSGVRVFKAQELAQPATPPRLPADVPAPRSDEIVRGDPFVDDPFSSSTPVQTRDRGPLDNQFVD